MEQSNLSSTSKLLRQPTVESTSTRRVSIFPIRLYPRPFENVKSYAVNLSAILERTVINEETTSKVSIEDAVDKMIKRYVHLLPEQYLREIEGLIKTAIDRPDSDDHGRILYTFITERHRYLFDSFLNELCLLLLGLSVEARRLFNKEEVFDMKNYGLWNLKKEISGYLVDSIFCLIYNWL